MADFINGDLDVLSIWREDAWTPVACLTSNSLSESVSFRELQTKCSPGVTESSPLNHNYTIAIDGMVIDTTSVGGDDAKASWDHLRTIGRAKTKVEWKLSNGGGISAEYGEAYFENWEKTSPAGELITFTASLKGDGAIVSVDPHGA
jgi:hypothetical protein